MGFMHIIIGTIVFGDLWQLSYVLINGITKLKNKHLQRKERICVCDVFIYCYVSNIGLMLLQQLASSFILLSFQVVMYTWIIKLGANHRTYSMCGQLAPGFL